MSEKAGSRRDRRRSPARSSSWRSRTRPRPGRSDRGCDQPEGDRILSFRVAGFGAAWFVSLSVFVFLALLPFLPLLLLLLLADVQAVQLVEVNRARALDDLVHALILDRNRSGQHGRFGRTMPIPKEDRADRVRQSEPVVDELGREDTQTRQAIPYPVRKQIGIDRGFSEVRCVASHLLYVAILQLDRVSDRLLLTIGVGKPEIDLQESVGGHRSKADRDSVPLVTVAVDVVRAKHCRQYLDLSLVTPLGRRPLREVAATPGIPSGFRRRIAPGRMSYEFLPRGRGEERD